MLHIGKSKELLISSSKKICQHCEPPHSCELLAQRTANQRPPAWPRRCHEQTGDHGHQNDQGENSAAAGVHLMFVLGGYSGGWICLKDWDFELPRCGCTTARSHLVFQHEDAEAKHKISSWGTWGCEVSKFDWQYSGTETAYVLEGEVLVTPTGAWASCKPTKVQKGDLVVFPDGMTCVWQYHSIYIAIECRWPSGSLAQDRS
eukprot:Skav211998  [mRNA]  locus=scaffold304:89100:94511:+ [translate_table: standard]